MLRMHFKDRNMQVTVCDKRSPLKRSVSACLETTKGMMPSQVFNM